MDIIETLHACISTLERMSVTGFDNADRYVGVISTLRQLIAALENGCSQEETEVNDG